MLARKVRLWLDFRGKWMALGVGGPEGPGCLQRALGWNPAQCSVKSTASRERGGLASMLCPGINCMTLTKSLLFMGLSFPIF